VFVCWLELDWWFEDVSQIQSSYHAAYMKRLRLALTFKLSAVLSRVLKAIVFSGDVLRPLFVVMLYFLTMMFKYCNFFLFSVA